MSAPDGEEEFLKRRVSAAGVEVSGAELVVVRDESLDGIAEDEEHLGVGQRLLESRGRLGVVEVAGGLLRGQLLLRHGGHPGRVPILSLFEVLVEVVDLGSRRLDLEANFQIERTEVLGCTLIPEVMS